VCVSQCVCVSLCVSMAGWGQGWSWAVFSALDHDLAGDP